MYSFCTTKDSIQKSKTEGWAKGKYFHTNTEKGLLPRLALF